METAFLWLRITETYVFAIVQLKLRRIVVKPSRVNKTLKVSNSFQEVINNHTEKKSFSISTRSAQTAKSEMWKQMKQNGSARKRSRVEFLKLKQTRKAGKKQTRKALKL